MDISGFWFGSSGFGFVIRFSLESVLSSEFV